MISNFQFPISNFPSPIFHLPSPVSPLPSALCHFPDRLAPVTVAEIAAALGFTDRGVRKQAERGKLGVPICTRPYLFDPATLPEDVRRKVMARRRERDRALAAAATALAPVGPVYHVPLSHFTDEEQTTARQRADFVAEVDRLRIERPDWTVDRVVDSIRHREETAARRRGGDDSAVLRYPALLCGGQRFNCQLTVKNFQNWTARWKPWRAGPLDTANWWCLCDRYRGQKYHRPGDPKFWEILAALYETPTGRNLRQCVELACRQSLKAGVLAENLPTEKQVRYFYSEHADAQSVEGRRGGAKHASDKISVYIIRDWRRVVPDQCWSGDHHNLRIACRRYDASAGGWRFCTPWLTNWLDNASWFEVGFHISAEPNRDTIELALRKAVESRGGAPERLYFDNGRDYAAVFSPAGPLGYDGDRAASLCQSLGSVGMYALPHNPRAKVNERDYRIVDERFERLWPSYMGHNKAHLDALWTFAHPGDGMTLRHRLAKYPERHPLAGCLVNWELLPTVDDVRAAYAKWRAEQRHKMISRGRILAGQSPEQRYLGTAAPAMNTADFHCRGGEGTHRRGAESAEREPLSVLCVSAVNSAPDLPSPLSPLPSPISNSQFPISNLPSPSSRLRRLSREEIALAFLRLVGGKPQRVARGGVLSLRPPNGKAADDIFYRSDALLAHVGERVQRRMDISFSPPRLFAFEAVESERAGEHLTTWKLIVCEGPSGSVPNVLEVEAFTDGEGQETLRRAMRETRQHEKNIRRGEQSAEILRTAQRGVELAAGIRQGTEDAGRIHRGDAEGAEEKPLRDLRASAVNSVPNLPSSDSHLPMPIPHSEIQNRPAPWHFVPQTESKRQRDARAAKLAESRQELAADPEAAALARAYREGENGN